MLTRMGRSSATASIILQFFLLCAASAAPQGIPLPVIRRTMMIIMRRTMMIIMRRTMIIIKRRTMIINDDEYHT